MSEASIGGMPGAIRCCSNTNYWLGCQWKGPIGTCCKSPIPNKLVSSSAALQRESSITALLRWRPLRVPQPEAFLRGLLSQYQEHLPTKTHTRTKNQNSYLCSLRPCCRSCTAPDHKSQHVKTCRMMLGRPILAWSKEQRPANRKENGTKELNPRLWFCGFSFLEECTLYSGDCGM